MSLRPRTEINAIGAAVHGSIDYSELERIGVDPHSVIDFSASVNPFGPSANALAALAEIPCGRYPDRESVQLRRVLASRLAVSEDQLLIGNGSGELLWLIALAYFRPGDTALIVGPTYSEYARSAALMGARCVPCNAVAGDAFSIPVKHVEQTLRNTAPRVLYLCNPNNPTGRFLPPAEIESWAREFDQTLFVIDEAYMDVSWDVKSLLGSLDPNIVIVRSLSKAYGLAGLRLGFVVAKPEIVDVLNSVRIPWSVNVAAQLAGVAAIEDQDHQTHTLTELGEAKRAFLQDLRRIGLNPLFSSTLFFLIPVVDAAETRSQLLQSKILVRDCSSFGLPGFIRVATRRPDENRRFVETIAQLHTLVLLQRDPRRLPPGVSG